MDQNKILRLLLILGGITELFLGVLFILMNIFLNQIGFSSFPLFSQLSGTFVFCYGILLIYSSRNVEKYVIIPIINVLIRFIMIIFSIFDVFVYPDFMIIIFFAIFYDLFWSIIVLLLLKNIGIILKK